MRFKWALLALLFSASLRAQSTFTLQEEDDSLVSAKLSSDRGYTNGTRMLWTWQPLADSRLGKLGSVLCRGESEDDCKRWVTAGIGQNMYTPQYLLSRTILRGDRAYGGWLYGTLILDATRERTNDHVELYAGVIGHDSHAAEAQIFVHKHVTTASPDPLGWDTQIGEWAAVLAAYQRRWTPVSASAHDVRWFDFTPSLGGQAGNVFVNATAGATARVGFNLPSRFFVQIPGVPAAAPPPRQASAFGVTTKPEPNWDAFVYVIANASYVARNVFIDSSDDVYRIERRPTVRQHRAGASFRVRNFRFAYQYTWTSSEFRSLVRTVPVRGHLPADAHSYGMILISVGPNP